MSVLKKQILVNKQDYEKRWYTPMEKSLEDAFNDILSNFSEAEIDRSYDSEMNQYLKNEKGDIYYFDNFKYVYPKRIADETKVRVLNNSRGSNKFCCVRYNGVSIMIENYDIYGSVEISSYFLTDDARNYIKGDFIKGDMGFFLFQISGDYQDCIEKLQLGSKITIRLENGNLVSYDVNGDVIDSVPANKGSSFYREVETKVNYYNLINKTYGLAERQNSK